MQDYKFIEALDAVRNGKFSSVRNYDEALKILQKMCASERQRLARDVAGKEYSKKVASLCYNFVIRVYCDGKEPWYTDSKAKTFVDRLSSIVLHHVRVQECLYRSGAIFEDEYLRICKMLEDEDTIRDVIERNIGSRYKKTLEERGLLRGS